MFFYQDKVSYFRWQTKIWLAFVLLFGILWLVIWFSNDEVSTQTSLKQKEQMVAVAKMPTKIDKLTELFAEVAPVKFETITKDLRSYPPEFKDKKFFEKNKGKWAVQVMNVAEHKIIVDYLDTRSDRDKFAYFRYTDANKETRYVLTYGVLSSFQEAMGATKLVDFRLPNSVRVVPEEFRRYIEMIDDYERMFSGGNEQGEREIKLNPTKYEIPVAERQVAPKEKKVVAEKNNRPTAKNTVSLDEPKPKPKKPKDPAQEFAERKAKAEAEARKKASESNN